MIPHRSLGLGLAVLLVAGVGCKRHVRAEEVSAASSSSATPSDEDFDKQLAAPTLELKDDRVVLDGRHDFSCTTTTMRRIALLDDELAKNVGLWKMRHTGGRFEDVELATVTVNDAMGVVPVASVLMTAAGAGYPRMRVVAGGRTLTIRWNTPSPSAPPRDTLEVSQLENGVRLVFRGPSGLIRPNQNVASADEVGPALAKRCASSGVCDDLVVFSSPPTATFASIVPLLRATLESAPFQSGTHVVDFSLPGHPVTQSADGPAQPTYTWGRE